VTGLNLLTRMYWSMRPKKRAKLERRGDERGFGYEDVFGYQAEVEEDELEKTNLEMRAKLKTREKLETRMDWKIDRMETMVSLLQKRKRLDCLLFLNCRVQLAELILFTYTIQMASVSELNKTSSAFRLH
jgi:hypothetical protein